MEYRQWGYPTLLRARGRLLFFIFASTLVVALGQGCSQTKRVAGEISGPSIPTYSAPQPAYCGPPISYSGATVTIDGSARYQTWTASSAGQKLPVVNNWIRRAEVRITNSVGEIVQCSETDGTGHYSFVVPQSAAGLTVSVVARAYNSYMRAAVYDDPRYNNLYQISQAFTPDNSKTLSLLTASYLGDVKGGAFNILDQILKANDYLRSKIGNCSALFPGCANFAVAPDVLIYWKLGFNPGDYYSIGPLSYYLPGYSRLFILGGVNGNFKSEDTDHFDNSVILHEYGHFLEDALSKSDSPGGSHNGNKVIDPRLAWSEGWGNFFQAAVLNQPVYLDTYGNDSGSTGIYFNVDLENQGLYDTPIYDGEGNFREFSVSRLLWDATDNTPGEAGGSDNIADAFAEIWHSFTAADYWLRPSAAFRGIGLLHEKQSGLGTASWSGLRSIEKHTGSTADYAQYVSASGSCGYSMTPTNLSGAPFYDDGSFSKSHWLLNNDFYHLRLTSAQTITLSLQYSDVDGSGTEADLDLYLYKDAARFGVSDDWAGSSQKDPDGNAATPETESLTKALPAGNYLINVMAYTGGPVGGAVNYTLRLNGSQLCPAPLP